MEKKVRFNVDAHPNLKKWLDREALRVSHERGEKISRNQLVEEIINFYREEMENMGPMETAYYIFNNTEQGKQLRKEIKEIEARLWEEQDRRFWGKEPQMSDEEYDELQDKLSELVEARKEFIYGIHDKLCKERGVYNPRKDWYYHGYRDIFYEFRSNFYVQGSVLCRQVPADSLPEAWDKLTPPRP